MSSFINPKCQVPLYLTDKVTAVSCSKLDSYIFVIFLAIVVLCCIVYIYYYDEDLKNDKNKKYILSGILLCCICVSIIVIVVMPFMTMRSWQGYEEIYNAYGDKGIDRKNAALNLQAMQQTNISADAVRNGAYAIAFSNLFRK